MVVTCSFAPPAGRPTVARFRNAGNNKPYKRTWCPFVGRGPNALQPSYPLDKQCPHDIRLSARIDEESDPATVFCLFRRFGLPPLIDAATKRTGTMDVLKKVVRFVVPEKKLSEDGRDEWPSRTAFILASARFVSLSLSKCADAATRRRKPAGQPSSSVF